MRAAANLATKRKQAEQTAAVERIEQERMRLDRNKQSFREDEAKLRAKEEAIRKNTVQEPKAGARYNILTLSGGGAHGAYTAGVLCGWSDSGCRPEFDVVTGVSTGSLIACIAFAGPAFDADLKRAYTTTQQRDVFRIKKLPPLGLGTDSVATNDPLRSLIRQVTDRPEYFEAVAAAHAKGRRLYIGTTNLDTGRFVIWDMGAIASEGTDCARKLYVEIMAAATAIPPLVNPSYITVRIDGQPYTEMHVDGGTNRNLFFYPPSDWPGDDADPDMKLLAGANVYTIVAGKVYDDPRGTNPKILGVGVRVVSTLLSSALRNELFRMQTHCILRDMNSYVAAIPQDYPSLGPAHRFDPELMTQLFELGYTHIAQGRVWNQEKPGRAVSEELARRSTNLTTTPNSEAGPLDLRPLPRPVSPAPTPRIGSPAPIRPLRSLMGNR
jgi:hypothetical protein